MAATMRNPKKRRGVLEKSCQAKKASAGRAAALAVRYGGLGFSPTSKNRAVFSPEKIVRFAERVPHGIACNSLVSFCSQLCFDRCRFVINKNFSKNNSSFPVRQKGSSATVL